MQKLAQPALSLISCAAPAFSVDDLDEVSKIEEYVQVSQSVLIFLAQDYFCSANCIRELESALRAKIPITLVYETDKKKGGVPLATLRADCISQHRDAQALFDECVIIPWHRVADFRQLSLKRVAQAMLHAMPTYSHLDAPPELYVAREVSAQKLEFAEPLRLFASLNNAGAEAVATELQNRYNSANLRVHHAALIRQRPRSLNEHALFRKSRRVSLDTPYTHSALPHRQLSCTCLPPFRALVSLLCPFTASVQCCYTSTGTLLRARMVRPSRRRYGKRGREALNLSSPMSLMTNVTAALSRGELC